MTKSKAEKFFTATLTHIESESIRAWTQTERNRPIILESIVRTLAQNPKADPARYACMLTLTAMG